MLLVLTWPRMSQQFQLNEAITEQNAVCFSMEKGEFTPILWVIEKMKSGFTGEHLNQ